jgi:branched-chain amino acid transport system permease protein
MSVNWRNVGLYAAFFAALAMVGMYQSWPLALTILNMGLISAIMALGVNMQWGYAGLFNVGVMGFTAIGGLAVVLVSMPPVTEAWAAGAFGAILGLMIGAATIFAAMMVWQRMAPGPLRTTALIGTLLVGFVINRAVFVPAVNAIESVNPATEGYLGGLGLPVLLSWPVGAVMAAGAAWMIGKVALGLRSDYLAIATLGISEIVIAILKNEGWLSRGVRNVTGLPRPVPSPVEVRQYDWVVSMADSFGMATTTMSSIVAHLAQRKGTELALGPDDARDPRQRDGGAGYGQGCHAAPPQHLHPRLGRVRPGGRDDGHARRAAQPRHL